MADGPTISVDDDEIALFLMDRDQEGVRLLLQVHGPRVLGFLRKYFPAQAEDALQEALKKVLISIDTFDDSKGKLGAWFLTIAHNAARDLVRGEVKHRHLDDDALAEVAAPDHGRGDSGRADDEYNPRALDAERSILLEILDTLTNMQRTILLRDAAHPDGKAPAALLADELDSTVGSIRANRAKAWRAVDEQLVKRGLPPRRKT